MAEGRGKRRTVPSTENCIANQPCPATIRAARPLGRNEVGTVGRRRNQTIVMATAQYLCSLVAAGAWLAGCAHFDPQPLRPNETAADFESRTLTSPELRSFIEKIEKSFPHVLPEWPPKHWDFNSLTLAAFYYHPSLDLARARWGVAQAAEITAGARPNPTISAGPQYNVNAARGVSPWLAMVDLDIPLETAGKRGYRIARAQHESESARLNIAAVAWQVRANLRAALLDLASAGRRAELLRPQMALEENALQRLEQKRAAGAITSSEILPHRSALQKARLELADAERQRAEARAHVADALGVPLIALAGIELPAALPEDAASANRLTSIEARRLALHSRADILAALADYAASQSALQLEIAKQYPNLNLGPGYEYDQGENKFGLQLSVELPVLNRNQGPIAEARARRAEAAARFTAVQVRVLSEIDRALAAYHAVAPQVPEWDALLATQRLQQQRLQQQLAAGAAEQLDLLTINLEIAATELARLEALTRRQQALGQLEDALQLPLDFVEAALLETGRTAKQETPP